MELKIITNPDGQFWKSFDKLSDKCFPNNVQLKSAWLKPYTDHQLKGYIYIICVYDEIDLVGCLPLQLSYKRATKYWNYKVLSFLGFGPTDFYDVLAVDNNEEVLKMMFHHLKSSSNWDFLNIQLLPQNSLVANVLKETFTEQQFEVKEENTTGYNYEKTNADDWESYYQKTFKSKNKDLRKGERRLKNDEIEFTFKSYKKDVYNQFMSSVSLYAERRDSLNQYNYYEDENYRKFLHDVCENYEAFEGVELTLMQDKNNINIALQLDFINKGIFYHWNHAFNEDFKRYSPGKILLQERLKTAFENENINECNHMRGLSSYKEKFTSFKNLLSSYEIKRKNSTRVKSTQLASQLIKLVK